MNPILRISIEVDGRTHSGIVLDIPSVEKAGCQLFEIVVKQLIESYKNSTEKQS